MKYYGLIAALVLVALPLQFGVAKAADSDSMAAPSMDCATAKTTMMNMSSPDTMKPMAMDANAGVDQMFATQMEMMSKHGMQMAKLEAKCGKDAKTRSMAAKMVNDLQLYITEFATRPLAS